MASASPGNPAGPTVPRTPNKTGKTARFSMMPGGYGSTLSGAALPPGLAPPVSFTAPSPLAATSGHFAFGDGLGSPTTSERRDEAAVSQLVTPRPMERQRDDLSLDDLGPPLPRPPTTDPFDSPDDLGFTYGRPQELRTSAVESLAQERSPSPANSISTDGSEGFTLPAPERPELALLYQLAKDGNSQCQEVYRKVRPLERRVKEGIMGTPWGRFEAILAAPGRIRVHHRPSSTTPGENIYFLYYPDCSPATWTDDMDLFHVTLEDLFAVKLPHSSSKPFRFFYHALFRQEVKEGFRTKAHAEDAVQILLGRMGRALSRLRKTVSDADGTLKGPISQTATSSEAAFHFDYETSRGLSGGAAGSGDPPSSQEGRSERESAGTSPTTQIARDVPPHLDPITPGVPLENPARRRRSELGGSSNPLALLGNPFLQSSRDIRTEPPPPARKPVRPHRATQLFGPGGLLTPSEGPGAISQRQEKPSKDATDGLPNGRNGQSGGPPRERNGASQDPRKPPDSGAGRDLRNWQPREPERRKEPYGGDGLWNAEPQDPDPGTYDVEDVRPLPTVNTAFKIDMIPKLEKTSEVLGWLRSVDALLGRAPQSFIGAYLWMVPSRFEGIFKVSYERASLGVRRRATESWPHLRDFIIGDVCGNTWLNERRLEYSEMSFRQAGHGTESPFDFVVRRMDLQPLVTNDNTTEQAIFNLMSQAPVDWKYILQWESETSIDALLLKLRDNERALVSAYDRGRTLDRLESESRRFHRGTGRVAEREMESSEGNATAMLGSSNLPTNTTTGPARPTGSGDVGSPRKYPFPKHDFRTTKKRLPPRPCRCCGHPEHWDNECRWWLTYRKSPAYLVDVKIEPEDEREAYYDEMIVAMDFSQTAMAAFYPVTTPVSFPLAEAFFLSREEMAKAPKLLRPAEGSAEGKDYTAGGSKTQGKVLYPWATSETSSSEVGTGEEVTTTSAEVGERRRARVTVEEVPDEGDPPVDEEESKPTVKIKSENNGISAFTADRDFSDNCDVPDEGPERLTAETFIANRTLIKLPRVRSPPKGMSSLGVAAQHVWIRVSHVEGPKVKARTDSGASLSLVSQDFVNSLVPAPDIKKGLNFEISQLTGTARPLGYVTLPIYFFSLGGEILEAELEAYVVKGMTVPMLIGEDFMLNHELHIRRNVNGGTSFTFGGLTQIVRASSVQESAETEAFVAAMGRLKEVGASAKATPAQSPQAGEKDTAAKQRIRDKLRDDPTGVLAAATVRIPGHSLGKVLLAGHFDGRTEWLVEPAPRIRDAGHSAWSAPPSLVSSAEPFVFVANMSDDPAYIEAGDEIGVRVNPEESLDRPKTEAEWSAMANAAEAVGKVIDAMGRKDSPQTPTEGDDQCDEERVGPKTAEAPDPDPIQEADLEEAIDVSAEAPEWARTHLRKILRKNVSAFGFGERLGSHPGKVQIRTKEGVAPRSQPMYAASPLKREVIDKQLDVWFRQGVIEPSSSPWGAPVVIVFRNGKPRFCVDYRQLNAVTISDEHPIPRQSEIMQALSGAQVLSTMDALSGFTQLEMDETDKEKTAFRCHRGLFQFRRMPFGLRNGPAIFQRVMQKILAPYLWLFALVYIDDIVVYSKSWKDHLEHVDKVLSAIAASGITLSPKKCHFGYTSILLLGHKVSRLGISTHQEKIKAILDLARPNKLSELQTFLGLVAYFSQYIPNYASLASPLFALTRKDSPWLWSAECEEAFRNAKRTLCEAPVLAHPLSAPFRIYTDASDIAMGACLQQVQTIKARDLKGTKLYDTLRKAAEAGKPVPSFVKRWGVMMDDRPKQEDWRTDWEDTDVVVERVVAYWSKTFSSAERNYSVTEREALAAKEALIHYQPLIEGLPVILITDHAALQWARTYENANRRLASWGAIFSAFMLYGLEIVHRAGTAHSNVDPLSRLRTLPTPVHQSPLPPAGPTLELASLEGAEDEGPLTRRMVSAMAARTAPEEQPRRTGRARKPTAKAKAALDEAKEEAERVEQDERQREPVHLRKAENHDPELDAAEIPLLAMNAATLDQFVNGYRSDKYFARRLEELQDETLRTSHTRFRLGGDGLLFFMDADGKLRLCVPEAMTDKLIRDIHENPADAAHAGANKLYLKLAVKYFWPKMNRQVIDFVKTCDVCQKIKPINRDLDGWLRPLPVPERPFEVLSMDLITGLPPSEGYNAVWVAIDKLTKLAVAVPTINKLDKIGFARVFVDNVVCRFGMPQTIVCDRDGRWLNEFFREVAATLGAAMAYTSARHPRSNGQTERMNHTVEDGLKAYVKEDRSDWAKHLPLVLHAYNSTPHAVTGLSPYFLMYGFEPNGPSDLIAGTGPAVERPNGFTKDAKDFLDELEVVRDRARKALAQAKASMAKQHDRGLSPEDINEGDEVLINPHTLELAVVKGQGVKLMQRRIGPFKVQSKISDNVFDLELPDTYPMSSLINREHLVKYHRPQDSELERHTLPHPRWKDVASEEYDVEDILGERWNPVKERREYRVRWAGFGPQHDSWQTARDIRNAGEILREFRGKSTPVRGDA